MIWCTWLYQVPNSILLSKRMRTTDCFKLLTSRFQETPHPLLMHSPPSLNIHKRSLDSPGQGSFGNNPLPSCWAVLLIITFLYFKTSVSDIGLLGIKYTDKFKFSNNTMLQSQCKPSPPQKIIFSHLDFLVALDTVGHSKFLDIIFLASVTPSSPSFLLMALKWNT